MKKNLLLMMALATATTAGAQAVDGHKMFDNWSVGLVAGGATPTQGKMLKNVRSVAGVELTKDITPMFGLGVQTMAGFNTTGSHTAFDNLNTTVFGVANLTNIFKGYKGSPRAFEVEGVLGVGYNHYYGCSATMPGVEGSSFTSKLGLNLNFSLVRDRAWTLSVRPAIVYDLEGGIDANPAQYNLNHAVLELTVGVQYHFRSSNGFSFFTNVRRYNTQQIDALNAKINDLRATVEAKDKALRTAQEQLRRTQQALNDCRNERPVIQRQPAACPKQQQTSVTVTFGQGKSTVDASQMPNVERVATYMKSHPTAKVTIMGYASPEGNADVNARLAKARAEAVRDVLVKKFGISSSRITADGQGVGHMFDEPDWNRVSICTLGE